MAIVAGIAVGDRLAPSPTAVAGTAALAVAAAVRLRRAPRACALCACLLAFCAGSHAIGLRLARARADTPAARFDAAVAGRACESRVRSGYVAVELCGLRAVGLGERPPRPGVPDRALLVESEATPEGAWLSALVPGDRVRARLRFDALAPSRNPGAPDRARRAARRGIGARAWLPDARLAVRPAPDQASWRRRLARARARVAERLAAAGPGGGLLAALAVGDRRALAAADREAFRRLGIAHLLAVSGLHLVLVGALAYGVARAALRRAGSLPARADLRGPAAILAVVAGLAYALLAGWAVPVRRAWVFLGIGAGAGLLRRRPAPIHALAAATCWVALLEPAAVFEAGPQLSFAATAALVLAARSSAGDAPRAGGLARALRAAAAGLRVSATAIVATAPVLAAHGLSTAPAGLVANLAAVPLTGFVLLPASLAAAGAVAAGAPGGGAACAAWLAAQVLAAARLAATWLPPATGAGPAATLAIVFAGVLAALGLALRPTWQRVGACGLVCLVLAAAPRARVGPPPPRVVAFAVGQGDAILLEGRDAAVLVDGGWAYADVDLGRSIVVPGLRALGVERLDVVVASHADADHRGGLRAAVEAFPVGEIWVPRGADGDFGELEAVARRRRIPFRRRGAGDPPWRRGDVALSPLWPPPRAGARRAGDGSRNDASLVLRAAVAGTRVLLTGDIGLEAETALLASGAPVRAEILKVPHHGSATSSSPGLLAAVGFDLALLSAPCGGARGLPSSRALARLDEAGGSLWWTGRHGALVIALDRGIFPTGGVRAWGWRRHPRCRAP